MSVLVNSEEGKLLVKVKVGDSKLQAFQRLGQNAGILADKDGVGLLDIDFITKEGAPYVFKQQVRTSLVADSPPKIAHETLYGLLEEAKGSQLTDLEIQYIMTDYAKLVDAIVSDPDPRRRLRLARGLWLRLSIRVKTQTRCSVVKQYLFDGPVPGAFGSPRAEFQFAVRGSRLFCAKIMRDNDSNTLQREFELSRHLHQDQICPTVMRAVDLIRLPGEPKRVAMITPYFPLPLTPLAGGQLHPEGCVNVALCGLATIKAFNAKRLCHGDIKPGNMMLTTGENSLVVTIDFGSAAEYGNALTSTTPGFGLDLPTEASLSYDLACLASSIYILTTGRKLPQTALDLRQQISGIPSLSPALQIANLCLSNHDDIDLIWRNAITFLEGVQDEDIDDSLVIAHESLWPVRGG